MISGVVLAAVSFLPSFVPSFRNDSKDKRAGLGGTLACGSIQAHVSQRDTAGFRPVQPGSMRSATVPAMLSPAGTHQGHFSRDLIGICFGLLRAGRFDKWSGVCSSQLPSFLPSFRNDSKEKRVGLGGTLACGPIQALVTQRDTAGFRPVQPGSMRSASCQQCSDPQVLIGGTSAET